MKKTKKALLAALALSAMLVGTVGFTACSDKQKAHTHAWSNWTVEEANKPTADETGKATRICSGEGDCDAESEDKERELPALNATDYAKSADTATCSSEGKITYTYNKDGVNVNFDIATEINADAHKYGGYTYTDGTGHYKVCEYNADHKTAVEPHNTDGADGKCSVCGYKETTVTPPDPETHIHNWGKGWSVEPENMPTATKGGKATRTCSGGGNCNAEAKDKEYALPDLTSADYTKSADTATCSAAGIITYTYNKDGVSVSFDVSTAVNPNAHVVVIKETVYSFMEQTRSKAGKLQVVCDSCGAPLSGEYDYARKITDATDLGAFGNFVVLPKANFTVRYKVIEKGEHIFNINDLLEAGISVQSVKIGADVLYNGTAADASCAVTDDDGELIITVNAGEAAIGEYIEFTLAAENCAADNLSALISADVPRYKMHELTVGENPVAIEEANLTADSVTELYVFTAPQAGWYTVYLPDGLNASKYNNSNDESVMWINAQGEEEYDVIELAEGEKLSLMFIGNRETTFTVKIEEGKKEEDTTLLLNTPLRGKFNDANKSRTFTVGEDISEGEYFLILDVSPNFTRSVINVKINGGAAIVFGAGKGDSQEFDFKRKINLKSGDTVLISPDGNTEGVIYVTVKPVIDANKLGVGTDGAYVYTYADEEFETYIQLDDTVTSGYYKLTVALDGINIIGKAEDDGAMSYYYVDADGKEVSLTFKLKDLKGDSYPKTTTTQLDDKFIFTYSNQPVVNADGALEYSLPLDFAERTTNSLAVMVMATDENDDKVYGITATYTLTEEAKGDDRPDLPTATVLGIGESGSAIIEAGAGQTALKLAPSVVSGYYMLTVTAVGGSLTADAVFTLTGFGENDIVLSGAFGNSVSALVRFVIENSATGEFGIACSDNGVSYKVTLVRAELNETPLGVGEQNSATVTVNAQHGVTEYPFALSSDWTNGYYEITVTAIDGNLTAADEVVLAGLSANDIAFSKFENNTLTIIVKVQLSNATPKLVASLEGVTLKVTAEPTEKPELTTALFNDTSKNVAEGDVLTPAENKYIKVTASRSLTANGNYLDSSRGGITDLLKIELSNTFRYRITIVCSYPGSAATYVLKNENGDTIASVTAATSSTPKVTLIVEVDGGIYTLSKTSVRGGLVSIKIEDVETPAHEHVWSDWTVTTPPTANTEGEATRTCIGEGTCDLFVNYETYTLPVLTSGDYTVTDDTSTCTQAGTGTYSYNKNGVQLSFTAATVAAHSLELQKGFTATCTEAGMADYYQCSNCGKKFKNADGTEELENLAELELPAAHKLTAVSASATSFITKYPNNTDAKFNCIAHYECSVCHKTFKDEAGTSEITSIYALSRAGMFLEMGENKIDCTDVGPAKNNQLYLASFIADADAKYTFTFSEGVTIQQLVYILTGTKVNKQPYKSTGWNTADDAYSKFIVDDATQKLANTVTVNMVKGEWITFFVENTVFTVKIETEPVLKYGENSVFISEASAMFIDEYRFVPEESGTYSITVPAGVEVLADGKDLIGSYGDSFANFEAEQGVEIVFAFKNYKKGAITVTIGEKIEPPKLTTNGLNNLEFPARKVAPDGTVYSGVAVVEVGDVEAGTYKLSVSLPGNVMQGAVVCFGKNTSTQYIDYFASNGNFSTSDGVAEAYFQFPNTQTMNGATYTVEASGTKWYITLDLKKGDKLVFVSGSTTDGAINIAMEKV